MLVFEAAAFIHTFVGQSKHAGQKYVDAIMALEGRIRSLDIAIADADVNAAKLDPLQALERQTLLEDDRRSARKRLTRLETLLDGSSRQNLERLRKDKFLSLKANALALKTRLRDRLRQRKSEISLASRVHEGQSSGEFASLCSICKPT